MLAVDRQALADRRRRATAGIRGDRPGAAVVGFGTGGAMTGKHTEALGRWLGTHLETPERAISEKDMREEVIAGARRIQRRRRLQKAAGAISLTIAVLFGVTAVYRQGRVDQAIRFSLEPDAQPGQVGAYVAPSGAAPLGLRFSDGSHVELEPGARARVSETTARGATFLLETGRAEVDVKSFPVFSLFHTPAPLCRYYSRLRSCIILLLVPETIVFMVKFLSL